jgi:hypothetical protein
MLEFIIVWILFSPAVSLLIGKMIAIGNKNKNLTRKQDSSNKNVFFVSLGFPV